MEQEKQLRRSVAAALSLTDENWYHYLLQSDLGSGGLSPQEEDLVIHGSMEAAEELIQTLPQPFPEPEELLAGLNLTVTPVQEELREPFLYLAKIIPAAERVYFNTTLKTQLQDFILNNCLEDLTPVENILPLALYHESFHALEETHPALFTRSRMITRRLLGLFPYHKGLNSAPEIGAIHFSKILTGIRYSPCLYSQYVLLSLGKIPLASLVPNVLR